MLARADSGRHLRPRFVALEFIQRQKISGLAPLMLSVPSLWDEPDVARAARRALSATVRPEDADLLRAAMRGAEDGAAASLPAATRERIRNAAVSALPPPFCRK